MDVNLDYIFSQNNISQTIMSTNVSMHDSENMKTLLMQSCADPSCSCKERVSQYKHLIQGQYGMCWFVSVLNMMFLSDKLGALLRPYIAQVFSDDPTCWTPEDIKTHLENEVSGQVCTPVNLNVMKNIFKDTFSIVSKILEPINVLGEFISTSDDINRFNKEWFANSGGFPSHVLVPYILRLGVKFCSVKHLYFSFPLAKQYNIEPRWIKLNRLCTDYLRGFMLSDQDIQLFILTTDQSNEDQYNDIWNNQRHLFISRYICILDECNKQLVLYTLDCAALNSCDNNKTRSGHIVCAITCNSHGYLMNSYHPSPGTVTYEQALKSCSVYQYDWQQWYNKDDILRLQLHTDHTCSGGEMLNFSHNEQAIREIFNGSQKDEYIFTYHRDVGHNTYVYVKETIPLIKDENIDTLHELDKIDALTYEAYKVFMAPYFYLLKQRVSDSMSINLRFEYIGTNFDPNVPIKYDTHKMGIPGARVSKGESIFVHYYMVSIPFDRDAIVKRDDVLKLILDVTPDEIAVLRNPQAPTQIVIGVEYMRSQSMLVHPVFGGQKTKTTRPTKSACKKNNTNRKSLCT